MQRKAEGAELADMTRASGGRPERQSPREREMEKKK